MREVGIEAWPALVHSSLGRAVIERAPGPGAFDHVIAKVDPSLATEQVADQPGVPADGTPAVGE